MKLTLKKPQVKQLFGGLLKEDQLPQAVEISRHNSIFEYHPTNTGGGRMTNDRLEINDGYILRVHEGISNTDWRMMDVTNSYNHVKNDRELSTIVKSPDEVVKYFEDIGVSSIDKDEITQEFEELKQTKDPDRIEIKNFEIARKAIYSARFATKITGQFAWSAEAILNEIDAEGIASHIRPEQTKGYVEPYEILNVPSNDLLKRILNDLPNTQPFDSFIYNDEEDLYSLSFKFIYE